MKIFVEDREFSLLPGMTVRHALIAAGLLEELGRGLRVFDEWGNEVGLDGALGEGQRLYLKGPSRELHF